MHRAQRLAPLKRSRQQAVKYLHTELITFCNIDALEMWRDETV